MGWLDTALTVAQLGLQAGQISQLQGMRQQEAALLLSQMSDAARQMVVEAAKNEMFRIKQLATQSLKAADSNPKMAAGAVQYLQLRLRDSGITPNLFSDLRDKEYYVEVSQYLVDANARLRSRLTPSNLAEIDQVANAALNLPDLKYYIDKFSDVGRLRWAHGIVDDQKHRKASGFSGQFSTSCLGNCSYYFGLGFVLLMLLSLMLYAFVDNTGGIGIALAVIGVPATLLFLWWSHGRRQEQAALVKEYNAANELINTLNEDTDLDRFARVEQRFGTELDVVQQQFRQSQNLVSSFFRDLGDVQALIDASAA